MSIRNSFVGFTTRTSSPRFFSSSRCRSAPSKCRPSVTTLPSNRRSSSSAWTTRFSPALVLETYAISDGFALINSANSVFGVADCARRRRRQRATALRGAPHGIHRHLRNRVRVGGVEIRVAVGDQKVALARKRPAFRGRSAFVAGAPRSPRAEAATPAEAAEHIASMDCHRRSRGRILRGQRAEGRGQRAEGRGQRAEGRGQRAEGRGQRAKGRGQRRGQRERAEGCRGFGLHVARSEPLISSARSDVPSTQGTRLASSTLHRWD